MTNMKLFCTIVVGLMFVSVHGQYTDEGPCSAQSLAGCDPGPPSWTGTCDTSTPDGLIYHHFDGCNKKCSAPCKDHPDQGNRHAACDNPSLRTDCTEFVSECSKDCGVGKYTVTYRCGDTTTPSTIITCQEFCCCGQCTPGGGSSGSTGTGPGVMWPIPGYRNCEGRKGPWNDKVCNKAGLCSSDTLYQPDNDLCYDKEVRPKETWAGAQVECAPGNPMTIHTLDDLVLRRNLLGYNAPRTWTDLSFAGQVITSATLNQDLPISVADSVADGYWNNNQPSGNGFCILAGLMGGTQGWDDANCGLPMNVVCEYTPV